ncbi:MAG TPA: T9SS type A sorting domain-containing protein [bacterium]|jgi:hypothetical protein
MKSSYWLCTFILIMSTSLFATPSVIRSGATLGKAPLPPKVEIQQIMAQIDQARALDQEPDPALFDRIDELTGESRGTRGGALDKMPSASSTTDTRQGGEDCANAFTIPALPFSESGTLGSTDNCAGRPYRDVFYRYTAIQNGNHTFNMCGSSGDTYMRLWTEGTCCAGNNVADDNSCGSDYDPSLTLALSTGQIIYIECGKYNTSTASPYNFRAYGPNVPPANDLCVNAEQVAVPSQTMGTTLHASLDAIPACGNADAPTAPGVWYRVNGTGNMMTASLCDVSADWDTELSVFLGPCPSLTCVGGNDDYCDNRSQVTWCSVAGVQYFMLVHGYQGAYGGFRLDITDNGINCHQPNCTDILPCGTPAETEPNNICPSQLDPLTITCPTDDTGVVETLLYGTLCPADDHDVYRVSVRERSVMTVIPSAGTDCDSLPSPCIQSDVRGENCELLDSGSSTGWVLTNPGDIPVTFYLDVHGDGACLNRYKIATSCCPLRDYCANPINVGETTDFSLLVNTCCATSPLPFVFERACSGTMYAAGRAVIFRIHPAAPAIVDLSAIGGDAQIMVFTDCSNPTGTCIASSDTSITHAERIDSLHLAAGVYYVAVSRFSFDCGDITLSIHSDVILPVELASLTATAGRNEVTLHWQTASETSNDHFDIERDGQRVATISSQGNSPTGHSYTWTETGLENGRVAHFDLYGVDLNGGRSLLKSVEATPETDGQALIIQYALYQNYPNPFNPTTRIAFDLLEQGHVSLGLYNLLGQQVAVIVNGTLNPGHHVLSFDASYLPSGVYLYRIEVNQFVAERKMLLMK